MWTSHIKERKIIHKFGQNKLSRKEQRLQDPNLIVNSFPLKKKAFDKQVDIFKALSLEKFYNILEYGQDDIDHWLVDYSVLNEEIDQALCNLYIDLKELEKELFNIKIWNEINVSPLRSYIE